VPPGGTADGDPGDAGHSGPYAVGVSGRTAADRFVGRADELRRVELACARAREGRGTAFLVSGEVGIGKSRFCREVSERASERGLVVAAVRCWPEGGTPAMWPWPPVLDALCGPGTSESLLRDAGGPPDRFGLFVEVTARLAEACTGAPACVVIDDVDAAEPGALLLLRYVARSLDSLPLVLVLARGTTDGARVGPADPIATTGADRSGLLDAIEREAVPLPLHHLDVHEVASFMAGRGAVDPDLVLALMRITGGNPLHLLRVSVAGAGSATPATSLRLAIEEAFHRLDPSTRRLLSCTAVLGLTPSIAEASRLTGVRPGRVIEGLAEAARAGLVASLGPARFSFGHELARAVAEDALGASERLDAHARAAEVVVDPGAGPTVDGVKGTAARRAHHALLAAPRSRADARRAVDACRDAAGEMADRLAYESATALLAEAVSLHATAGLGDPPAPLLLAWARAVLSSGRLAAARPLFERAADAARRDHDPVATAEAALGLGGVWVNEHRAPVDRARVSSLQWAALAGLPAGEAALRSRLRSRLAAEGVYDGEPVDAVHDAIAGARRTGDARALAEALSLGHHALLTPEHVRTRLEMADELVAVASGGGLPVLALMGLCWRTVDLFHLGDPRARRALEDLREHADAVGCLSILYIVEVLDVMLLIRAGRLEEASTRATAAFGTGTAVGDVDAFAYFGAQTVTIHWLQGREADVLEMVEEAATSTTLEHREFAFRATAADLAARCGRTDRARAALSQLAGSGLATLPRSSTWLTGMAAIAETAYLVGEPGLAAQARTLLEPFAALPVMPSLGVVCLGSTERALGLAALGAGDAAVAVSHLGAAVAANARLGNRPLTAMARAELATAFRRRGAPGDAARAHEALEAAAAGAEACEMPERAREWRDEARDQAAAAVVDVSDGSGLRSGSRRGSHASLRRRGRGWLVCLDDRRVSVGDRVGFAYLARLVEHPGEEIGALALASGDRMADTGPRQEVLDAAARRAYAARARELTEDLDDAESRADLGRAERLRDELDALVDEVERSTSVDGRSRGFAGPAERARTSVRKAIVRALDEIAAADPEIGAWFRPRVVTGSRCCYRPDDRADRRA